MSVNVTHWPGTALRSGDIEQGRVLTVGYQPRAQYAWDAGIAMSRYLAELKNGRLIGTVCNECRRVMIPPRMICEECFRPVDGWEYLRDTGTINTFSLSHVRWDMVRLDTPQMPAVIEIDGASPGHGILHLLGDVNPSEIRIGMKVRAVWKPAEERTGSITDIMYFRPEEG